MLNKYSFAILLVLLSFRSYAVCNDIYLPASELDLKSIHSLLFKHEPVENRTILFKRLEESIAEALIQKKLRIEGAVSQARLSQLSKLAQEASTYLIIESSPYFRDAVASIFKNYVRDPSDLEAIRLKYKIESEFRSEIINDIYYEYQKAVSVENRRIYIETLQEYEMALTQSLKQADWLNGGMNRYESQFILNRDQAGVNKFKNFLDKYFQKLLNQGQSERLLGSIGKIYLEDSIVNKKKFIIQDNNQAQIDQKVETAIQAKKNEDKPRSSYKLAAKIFVMSNAISYYLIGSMNDFQTPYITGAISTKLSLLMSLGLTIGKLRYERSFGPIVKTRYESLFYRAFNDPANLSQLSLKELVQLKKLSKKVLKKYSSKLSKVVEKIDRYITKKNPALLN